MLRGTRVVAYVYYRMQPQIPQRLHCQMARGEIIVPHVSARAYSREDDDVFTRHVSDAGTNRARDVHRPHGPEAL